MIGMEDGTARRVVCVFAWPCCVQTESSLRERTSDGTLSDAWVGSRRFNACFRHVSFMPTVAGMSWHTLTAGKQLDQRDTAQEDIVCKVDCAVNCEEAWSHVL